MSRSEAEEFYREHDGEINYFSLKPMLHSSKMVLLISVCVSRHILSAGILNCLYRVHLAVTVAVVIN